MDVLSSLIDIKHKAVLVRSSDIAVNVQTHYSDNKILLVNVRGSFDK